uniref:Uncharacterized protein n=1 Tax=Anopheles atroparvus TaxID=41427 RepID=A0A182J646_ANOAO
LKRELEDLKLSYDNLRQEAYSTSLELKVITKANAELSSELIAAVNENDALCAKQERLSHQHDTEIRNLQSAIEQLRAENADMKQCIETLSEQLCKSKSEARKETVTIAEPYDSIQHLDEIKKLNAKLMESELKHYELQQAHTALSDEYARLTERCDALQSNYENAKHEKEELQNLLDAAQEQWRIVSDEMQELRNNPDWTQKGNSLFAEVDDQRKKLINIMRSNNKLYYTLKAEHQKCPQRIQCLQNELTHLNSRVKLYEDSVGCADKSYVKEIQQQNGHIMHELRKEFDRNNFLQQELANNSEAWVKSLVKYNL